MAAGLRKTFLRRAGPEYRKERVTSWSRTEKEQCPKAIRECGMEECPKRGQMRYKGILNWHGRVWSPTKADVERRQHEAHLYHVELIFFC